jgi:malate dehydrogenase (oxaloacetate-decarboxylating)(NADP+)
VGLGISAARIRRVTDSMFLAAAKALAEQVTEEDLAETAVYPQLSRIRECSLAVACATVRQAVKEGYADPEILDELEENLRSAMWEPKYVPIHFERNGN